ncbi:MAG: DUF4386 domain-containing protein [Terricaulis sp.]
MKERRSESSPRVTARLAGLFSVLLPMAVAGQANIRSMFVMAGNPAATATNILANQPLFQLGFTCSLIAVGIQLARALFIYELFKPVSKSVSLYAVFVILVGCAIQALASLFYLAPLLVLRDVAPESVTPQLQELAYLFIRLSKQTLNIYVVFLGFWFALIGCLIARSDFMPRIIGLPLFICGVAWMLYLFPPLARQMSPLMMLIGSVLGEASLALWLLVMGVNAQRWKDQAGEQRA